MNAITPPRQTLLLRAGLAFIWLATALGVLSPDYRALGATFLDPLGLPPWVMIATCVAEGILALRVAFGRATPALMAIQLMLIVCFTVILTISQPGLWLHPFGVLTKNLPLLAMVVAAWHGERHGWTSRTRQGLLLAMSGFWILEGVFPKDYKELPERIAALLRIFSLFQLLVGIFVLPRRFPKIPVPLYLGVLFVSTVLLGYWEPQLWVHPFGPLTKNVPIALAAWVLCLPAENPALVSGKSSP